MIELIAELLELTNERAALKGRAAFDNKARWFAPRVGVDNVNGCWFGRKEQANNSD